MKTTIIFSFGTLFLALVASAFCQVTFSKGWGPGKRTSDGCDYGQMATKNIAIECSLLNKLRQLIVRQKTINQYYQPLDPGYRQVNIPEIF
ncbi:hypothetical protein HCN44_004643 [Aphidius gifuensis]|uniref:Adipokinetic hormone n=1 Tax=Aphidius gifuensis TaxID=684658 RepID=A0A834XYH5_APHGI|nr:hypothetical protein HCN44_004643 [Aphidius gifuensis]